MVRFSKAPHAEHFHALKNIMKYLRHTRELGIVYRRSRPAEALPVGPFEFLKLDEDLPVVPVGKSTDLVYQADATYATDRVKRRLVSGIIGQYNYAAVLYKSHLQLIVAVSSTEAEFYAAVELLEPASVSVSARERAYG